jgi:hypothetical protein
MVHHQGTILPRFDPAKDAGCQIFSSRHAAPVTLAISETNGRLDGVWSNFTSAKPRPHKTALVAIGLVIPRFNPPKRAGRPNAVPPDAETQFARAQQTFSEL